jgi:hypothetical protein
MSAAQPLPGRLPSAGIGGAPEPMAATGPAEWRLVGAHYCYGCGYAPCLMAKYGGICSGAGPESPFWLGYLSLRETGMLADKPGWSTQQQAAYLDGIEYRAQVERANLLALARHQQPSAGEQP